MGLPFRTFTESTTLLTLLTGSKVTTAELGSLYNLSYRSIIESWDWSARKAETLVTTVAPYSTGTITATQASTTVTGSSTVWTSAMTGRKIRIDDEDVFYTFTYVSATSGTLDKAWAVATTSAASYEIFEYVYDVDSTAGEVGQVLMPNEGHPFAERSLDWVTARDPARRGVGTPLVWVPHGLDSSGNYQIEFWPRYDTASIIRIPYYKRVDDIASSTKPIIQSDVIEELTLHYAFRMLAIKYGNNGSINYGQEADKSYGRYNELLEDGHRVDLGRHALPRAVQDYAGYTSDYDFRMRNDVDF